MGILERYDREKREHELVRQQMSELQQASERKAQELGAIYDQKMAEAHKAIKLKYEGELEKKIREIEQKYHTATSLAAASSRPESKPQITQPDNLSRNENRDARVASGSRSASGSRHDRSLLERMDCVEEFMRKVGTDMRGTAADSRGLPSQNHARPIVSTPKQELDEETKLKKLYGFNEPPNAAQSSQFGKDAILRQQQTD